MLAAIPNPFDPSQLVETTIRGFLGLLAKGTAALLGGIVGWVSGPVTEADLTRPWALDAFGRALAVAAAIAVAWLICTAAAGAVRRGPAGALEPLGRLAVAGVAIGFLRLWAGIGQEFSDALTVWLAPNFKADIEKIMAAMVTWPATVPTTALMVWWLLSLLAFVAVLILAIQLFLRKWAILLLWVLIPFAAVFSIGQQGMTMLKRHAVVLTAVLLAKPAMAFVFSLLAAPLADGGDATLDEGFTAVAGLGLAAFAPWVIVGMLARSIAPAVARTSKAGDPVAGTQKAVSTATAPGDTGKHIRQRLDSHANTQAGNRAAWNRNRPLARDAAVAAGAAAATGGAALPAAAASVGKNGAAKAGAVVTKAVTVPAQQYRAAGGQVSREFGEQSGLLVADKAGRVVDVGAHVPAEPAGLGPNERLAWRREHLTRDDPTPAQPPPPRRAPTFKENGQP